MAKGSVFSNDFLKLIFNAVAIANIADNAAASPLVNLFGALHSADPSGGDQSTSEVAYTGYARVAIARTSGGWTVTANSVNPVVAVTFGEMTAGTPVTATHFSVGTLVSGSGKLLWSGSLSPTIPIDVNRTPSIKNTSTITET